MKRLLLFSAISSLLALPTIAGSKVGDVVDLTPTIKGYVVKANGTNHEVEIYANPDNKPTGDLDIPYLYSSASSDTYCPVRIAAQGFKQCDLTSVSVGGGMEYIGKDAFYGCVNLKSFTEKDPGSIGSVGEYAFYRTDALEKISLPGVYTLNQWAFYRSGIKSANFTNLEYLYAAAFYECFNLETFTGGEKLKYLDNIAFCKDEKLKYVLLGPNLSTIGSMAFAFCTSLKEIVIPENITSIAKDAFEGLSMERVFILSPDFMEFCDQSKILRNKYLQNIYCPADLINDIKNYIATGTEENRPDFLASQAEIHPLSDLVEVKQEIDDDFTITPKYGDISAMFVFNPETGSEIRGTNYHYNLTGDKIGLQYRVDWKNLLRYTVTLDRASFVNNISSEMPDDPGSFPVYFDLQGREVKNPSKGIYIIRENGKTKKITL
ncbi:MAG: leucine-rich repeat domain-containing protein [Muribaculaceae bacterium]|nr:leucine-rich repeat domain-containing protein [Muribaculaceae bacterium]